MKMDVTLNGSLAAICKLPFLGKLKAWKKAWQQLLNDVNNIHDEIAFSIW
ncbi:hypothetical protein [Paenibacillus albidus]|nr:hypothetical protein [Paenibacillus albidus]